MDPYLEDPVLWPGVHQGLITGIRNALNSHLPPGYVADIGERLYVVQPDRSIYPDVVVFEQPSPVPAFAASSSGAALADPPIVIRIEPIEVREVFVEILPVGDESRVVTVIELLSYANKAGGSEGHNRYLAKQKELMESSVHFIEIDLLRAGGQPNGYVKESLSRHQTWSYLVTLSRNGMRDRCETWPIKVRSRLPRIRVPLDAGVADVTLDLQEVFDLNYDAAAYGRRIDYTGQPSVPLSREDADWADALLGAAGLRT